MLISFRISKFESCYFPPSEHDLIPGDEAYYDESGRAVPLANSGIYTALTAATRIEGQKERRGGGEEEEGAMKAEKEGRRGGGGSNEGREGGEEGRRREQ